jgi:zinc transport system substrate-binding protein
MAKAFNARVFVYVGAGLEPWAQRFLAARGKKDLVVVEAAQDIPLIREVEEHPGEETRKEEHQGHQHGAGNPHIWLDPLLAQNICRKITGALVVADPAHRDRYESNLANYLKALNDLDLEIRSRVAGWRTRAFISFHPAFAYFARCYGLKEAGVLEPAPGREPTPRHLQEIVKFVKELGLKVVFAEPQLNPRVAETVAREAGVKVLMLDPIGGRPPYGSDYLQLMRHNLAVMEEAMK